MLHSTSTARASLAVFFAVALLASSGCGMLHRPDGSVRFLPRPHNSDYQKSAENRPLEVPPDLDTPATDPAMQVPAVRGGSMAKAATNSNPAFDLSDTPAGAWNRMGKALEHIDGATVTQRSQLLNSYEVQFKGTSLLLRATQDGASSRIDATGPDGQPVRTPEAIELLNQLRDRLG
ncbi:MAG TPA: hypothetical protein VGH80_08330 [Xanthomonadaceae bacterium]|jgi:uncharacterized lipoprotein